MIKRILTYRWVHGVIYESIMTLLSPIRLVLSILYLQDTKFYRFISFDMDWVVWYTCTKIMLEKNRVVSMQEMKQEEAEELARMAFKIDDNG